MYNPTTNLLPLLLALGAFSSSSPSSSGFAQAVTTFFSCAPNGGGGGSNSSLTGTPSCCGYFSFHTGCNSTTSAPANGYGFCEPAVPVPDVVPQRWFCENGRLQVGCCTNVGVPCPCRPYAGCTMATIFR